MCVDCDKKCEGEKIASTCIIWEGKHYHFTSFNSLIESVVDITQEYIKEPQVDLKTLSNEDLTRDDILQLLVDNILQLKSSGNSSSTTVQCGNLNISSINSCGSCNQTFCEKLQIMVDTIAQQQAEIEQIKQTLYN